MFPDIKTIREKGMGANFVVLDPVDGYRKDNRLWVGTCDSCGQRVYSSFQFVEGLWTHDLENERVEFCPKNLSSNVGG